MCHKIRILKTGSYQNTNWSIQNFVTTVGPIGQVLNPIFKDLEVPNMLVEVNFCNKNIMSSLHEEISIKCRPNNIFDLQ